MTDQQTNPTQPKPTNQPINQTNQPNQTKPTQPNPTQPKFWMHFSPFPWMLHALPIHPPSFDHPSNISHQYKTTGKIRVLYILIFTAFR